ncbi:hypothetical protein L596_027326 [Steinernema carpocapsae]|uniref:Uncharacterized protein n=1 Tax=Steinernema carpocapsae TaxID=34508 RepID=A0A4U5M418_STECR|nr:hypothetical protein L596_027326 [Steinernema carpocapsae]
MARHNLTVPSSGTRCVAALPSIVVAVLTVVFAVLGLIGSVLQWFAYVHHWSVPAIGIIHSLILFTAGIFALFNVGILVYVILVSILVVADLLIGFGIIALSIRFQHTGDRFAFLPYYDHLWNYLCGVVYLLVMLAELVFAFCMLKARQIVKATEPRRMNSGIVYQPAYYGGVPPPISARTQHSSRTYEM